ncbi:YebC/PmpR family DNA-binding transcriptional regulator [Roseospirillum parvum]|uniref:Probable transcriptional regulatory protein SAMN05421742_10336 n=1 Tax=Roseospirillum parvum TaxID=83401 RepID=A0A1G7XMM6_9PROT|nr:YebC/PmpR family DNA-binding transcriptional regulator [Roseospirillum parvum]SDG85445.1 DNA-binding regulatory protein, YebC/PmpR family [Roseospirillum parvum]
MAGHSKFKNIMYRKGAQDARRAKLFTKLAKEIQVSAKEGGDDPSSNPRLRAALAEARKNSMPKDNIERALKRATGGDATEYEAVRYEGMGPGNVAVIVEALTDNRNRTAAEVRSTFTKFGGALSTVAFNFERVGYIHYPAEAGDAEAVLEAAILAGASDVESGDEGHDVYTEPDDFSAVRAALEESLGEPDTARLDWRALNTIEVGEEQAPSLLKFIDLLEDSDDVQRVCANYDIADDVLERLQD